MPVSITSRAQLEFNANQCVMQGIKTALGRGPQDCRTQLCDLMLVSRCKIGLQAQEQALLRAGKEQYVRNHRRKILKTCSEQIAKDIAEAIGIQVLSVYLDNSPVLEEAVLVITLDQQPELSTESAAEKSSSKTKKVSTSGLTIKS